MNRLFFIVVSSQGNPARKLQLQPVSDRGKLTIWLTLQNIAAKWKRPPKEWHAAKAQLAIQFGERFIISD